MGRESLRERGIALHRAGRLDEAERVYADALRANPNDADVLHMQGVLAHQRGRHTQAVELIYRAISCGAAGPSVHVSLAGALMALDRQAEALSNYDAALRLQPGYAAALSGSAVALRELQRPAEALDRADAAIAGRPSVEAHCVRAAALADLQRLPEALASYEAALALQPDCIPAHNGYGLALLRLQRPHKALASFERALTLAPPSAQICLNRGNALRRLRRLPEALASYDQAIALQPKLAAAHNNRGLVLQELQRSAEAVKSYQRAIELRSDFAEAYNNLAAAQCDLGDPQAALVSGRRALQLRPAMTGVHGNLGHALRDLGRSQEALAEFDLAIAEQPDSAVQHCNRGTALLELSRIPEAIASFDQALALNPAYAVAAFDKGLSLLLSGDFAQGWPLYERRKQLMAARARPYGAPEWDGKQPLAGSSILLHADQALGDTLQFARYARLAAARGARVVLAAQPRLRELLGTLGSSVIVTSVEEAEPECDWRCALASLPGLFGTTLENIPAEVPYLAADPARVAHWGQHLPGAGFRIGIVWQGSRNRIDHARSIPLQRFARLAKVPGVVLISLQKGDGAEQLASLAAPLEIRDLGPHWDEGPQAFLDTAAVMSHLDLVITCDTALAHLAGALARPTWLALRHVPDWRWLLERSDSPWYPSMRLFRQAQPGNWEGVFEALERALRELLQGFMR